ncbi:MAG TPA: PaaI family thioesterase [Acidimicrobiia bacterium]|jgi:uncharacterized protein (TIGR00369 family)
MSYSPISDRRPVPGFFADPADLELSGFERHRRSVRRESEPPAVKHLAGLQPTEVSMGKATFSMPASGWLTSPAGFIAPGALAFLADAPLSVAIESVLPPGKTSTTSELSFNFVAPAFSGPGHLVARASVIDVGSRLGFSEAVLTDQHGRLVAHATSRCVILDAPELDSRGQRPVDPEWTDTSRPDPWTEEPTGTVDLEIDRRSGLDALRMFVSGELERPPIGNVFGTRPTQVSEGEIIWTAAASPWWSSPAPFVYGGALSVLAEVAHNTAFWTLIPAGSMYANLDLKVQFVRPVFADGSELTARGFVTHRGRSIMIAGVEVVNAEGKTVLHGTGSAAVLPEGLALLLAQRPT